MLRRKKHTPNVRFQPLHQKVGGNLEDNVRNEEDGKSNIRLLAHEMQVLGKIHSKGIGYVDT